MAQLYNPWQSPPETGTLSGDLASFEINNAAEPQETEEDSIEDMTEQSQMQQALQVIDRQSQIINQLLSTLKL